MPHPTVMSEADTALLVIDVQEKLITKIPQHPRLVANIAFLIDAAQIANIPLAATEQYPKGLGATIDDLAKRLPHRPDKIAFSSCAVTSIVDGFRTAARRKIVLVGIESHVCVQHTALDLLALGFQVYIAVDAVGSRYEIDHNYALRRLENTGAILTTVESCAFEWVAGAAHPRFKEISQLVQDRMKSLTES